MARVSTKERNKKENDFEITNGVAKNLEKRLNGIERHPKIIIKDILNGNLPKIKFKSKRQKEYVDLIGEKEITIAIGPAGSGKSFLGIYKAFQLLLDPDNNYNEIIICTPAVESEEKLGFLPGSIEEKLDPYVYSTYYLMEKLIGKTALNSLIEKKIIRILAFAFMRGINVDGTILLAEEGQNTTIKQMKTLLTRIGENSKFIISGDIEQNDRFKKREDSGLNFVIENLNDLEEVGLFEFGPDDIVRNPLIGKILKKFQEKGK